jgi:hypothetical protein
MQLGSVASKRLNFKAVWSCYDAFLFDVLGFNEMCVGCISSYQDKILKTKQQHLMGRSYHCIYPTVNVIAMPDENPIAKIQCSDGSDEDKENLTKNSVRKRKKQNVKKEDSEKVILRIKLVDAESLPISSVYQLFAEKK